MSKSTSTRGSVVCTRWPRPGSRRLSRTARCIDQLRRRGDRRQRFTRGDARRLPRSAPCSSSRRRRARRRWSARRRQWPRRATAGCRRRPAGRRRRTGRPRRDPPRRSGSRRAAAARRRRQPALVEQDDQVGERGVAHQRRNGVSTNPDIRCVRGCNRGAPGLHQHLELYRA